MALKIRCLGQRRNKHDRHIGKGLNLFVPECESQTALVVLVSFSTKSHLLTKITTPLWFRCASQKIF